MNLKLKARWRLVRYHREVVKLAHEIDAHQDMCYEFRRKHCLDKDSTRRLLSPWHSDVMDIMLAKDREMCAKHEELVITIKAFRKEHGI